MGKDLQTIPTHATILMSVIIASFLCSLTGARKMTDPIGLRFP